MPSVKLDIELIAPVSASIVTEHSARSPVPVNDFNGILLTFVTAYPDPFEIILNEELDAIGAPWPSITPVTELSSASFAAPVLTFLPIGNTAFVFVPVPSILTLIYTFLKIFYFCFFTLFNGSLFTFYARDLGINPIHSCLQWNGGTLNGGDSIP